jgi:hypothetical protein
MQVKELVLHQQMPGSSPMSPTTMGSTVSLLSDSSSVYSQDEASEANATGTQIHHRSKFQPASKGSTPGVDWDSDKSSIRALPSRMSEAIQNSGFEHGDVKYRFVSADEAERSKPEYVQQVAAGNSAWNNVSRHLGLPLHQDEAVLAGFEYEDIGPRPPTPPRRRPPMPSISTFSTAIWRDTSSSIGSVASSSIRIDQGQSTKSSAAQVFNPISENSESSSLQTTEYHDVTFPRRQGNCINALQAPTAHTSSDSDSNRGLNPSQRELKVTRSKPDKIRRQGKIDWRTNLTIDTAIQANPGLASATGEIYGLGDHDAGYNNGDFVTDVQNKKTLKQEPQKKPARRFFCF